MIRMKTAELYDRDFAEWAQQNAELLRSGRVAEADLEHIAEEIEDLAKRERSSLYNRCVRLIEHLLKWQYQPERRGSSWQRTIINQREGIRHLLDENPSFRPGWPDVAAHAYHHAVKIVAVVTGRSKKDFPEASPFTVEQLLDDEFLP
jgi:Domain of unknown function DUF29